VNALVAQRENASMLRTNLTSVTQDHVLPIAVAIANEAGNDSQKTIEIALRLSPVISEILTTGQVTDNQKAINFGESWGACAGIERVPRHRDCHPRHVHCDCDSSPSFLCFGSSSSHFLYWNDRYNSCLLFFITSSTAQGGGGSFKNRKPIGEVGWCESGMAELEATNGLKGA